MRCGASWCGGRRAYDGRTSNATKRGRRGMKRLWPVIVAALLLASGGTAQAQKGGYFWTGNNLLRVCNASLEVCLAYVAGVVDAAAAANALTGSFAGFKICIRGAVSVNQAKDVILNYLRAHPEQRDANAASIAAYALQRAFHCQNQDRGP